MQLKVSKSKKKTLRTFKNCGWRWNLLEGFRRFCGWRWDSGEESSKNVKEGLAEGEISEAVPQVQRLKMRKQKNKTQERSRRSRGLRWNLWEGTAEYNETDKEDDTICVDVMIKIT